LTRQKDSSDFHESKDQSPADIDYRICLESYFTDSVGSITERLENFAKYVPRQKLTHFISRYEMFKRVLQIQGSIIECGIRFGGGTHDMGSTERHT